MKHEQELKIQALLDAELPAHEAREVTAWIETTPQARALLEELRATKDLVATHELPRVLPETREFYWSGIERQIRHSAPRPAHPPRFPWWLRLLAPAAAAAFMFAAVLTLRNSPDTPDAFAASQEIETPMEGVRTFSFHAPEAGMTVVWVENRFNW